MNTNKFKNTNQKVLGVLALLCTATFWGFGFPALKVLGNIPPFYINFWRFLISALLLAIIFRKHIKLINKQMIKDTVIISIFLYGCYALTTIGMEYTTSARASFFTCLGAIGVPLINLILFRIIPNLKLSIAIIICVIGVYLISIGGGNADIGFSGGDLICLSASIFGSAYTIGLGRKSASFDPIAFSMLESALFVVYSLIGMIANGEISVALSYDFSTLEIASMIFTGIGCSAIAFVCQTYGMARVSSNKASLILTLEPVLGGITSAVFLGDRLGTLGVIGSVLVAVSIIISETDSSDDVLVETHEEEDLIE
ncbi:MAG: DMT family transporter [Clostridia bacterium]|nr:DMT family transporter [Clostridia bacterium]